MLYDVRSIANFVLDLAEARAVDISNMAVNKIVYFIYVDYLLQFERPITGAKIEAWEHGPVFRELYSAFKGFGDGPIMSRASKIDPSSGDKILCKFEAPLETREFIERTAESLIFLSAAKLRQLSHGEGGPWDEVWNHKGSSNVGMRISDSLIRGCIKGSRKQ